MISAPLMGTLAGSGDTTTIVGIQPVSVDATIVRGVPFSATAWLDLIKADEAITVRTYLQADVGVSMGSGNTVLGWNDQSGSAKHATKDGPGTITRDLTGLNGRAILTLDGLSALKFTGWNPQKPSIEPQWWYLVFRVNTWSSGGRIIGSNSSNLQFKLAGSSGSPTVNANNGAVNASDDIPIIVGNWYRAIVQFAAETPIDGDPTTGDSCKMGSDVATRKNLGDNDPATVCLGERDGHLSFASVSYVLATCCWPPPNGAVGAMDATTVGAASGWGTSVAI